MIFTGKGTLQAVTINTTAAGYVWIMDGDVNIVRAKLKPSVVEGTYWYNIVMSTGLTVALSNSSDVTVTWTQG